jgi:hypothetical protein
VLILAPPVHRAAVTRRPARSIPGAT